MQETIKIKKPTEQSHPKILPPHVAIASLILVIVLHYLYSIPLIPKPFSYLGIVFFVLGLLILFWSFGSCSLLRRHSCFFCSNHLLYICKPKIHSPRRKIDGKIVWE